MPVDPMVVGKLGSCYGIYGWIRVFSFTENPKDIFLYQPWFIKIRNQWEKLEIEKWRYYNNGLIIKFKEIDDRNSASLLTNLKILINSSKLPKVKDDSYYWRDLVGCLVFTLYGYHLGRVVGVMETKSNDILIIKADQKDSFNIKERLIPFLKGSVIKDINLDVHTIKVDWDPVF